MRLFFIPFGFAKKMCMVSPSLNYGAVRILAPSPSSSTLLFLDLTPIFKFILFQLQVSLRLQTTDDFVLLVSHQLLGHLASPFGFKSEQGGSGNAASMASAQAAAEQEACNIVRAHLKQKSGSSGPASPVGAKLQTPEHLAAQARARAKGAAEALVDRAVKRANAYSHPAPSANVAATVAMLK